MFLQAAVLSNILLVPALGQQTPAQINSCHKDSFIFPEVAGAELIGITAHKVTNYTHFSVTPGVLTPASFTIDFCNVTVSYTHPGWDDMVNANIWLPLHEWNGRFYALGGGGYSVGFGPMYMTKAVATGFAAVQSDGGVGLGFEAALSPKAWALASRGNVNLHNLENYASRGVFEMTFIGKAITESYYGRKPTYSYFAGCSGGGRQALMVAQRLPEEYDGILAAAPAANIENFIPAGWWGQHTMYQLGAYPSACEIDSFTQAAMEACDELDGVKDGVISAPESCAEFR